MVDSLITAADDAHTRYYETTGFDFLDHNNGRKTTKGTILGRMDVQLDVLLKALDLFDRGHAVSPASNELKPFLHDHLLEVAGKLELAFTDIYGVRSKLEIRKIVGRLRGKILTMKRGLQTLKGDQAFRQTSAFEGRGPHPLQMLYLNASFAVGWLDLFNKDLVEDAKPDNDDPSSMDRLAVAIQRASQGMSTGPIRHHPLRASDVGQLFFTLRHIRVRDPHSRLLARFQKDKEVLTLLDAFRKAHAGTEASTKPERWSVDCAVEADAEFRRAAAETDANSRAIVAEAQGVFSIRMTADVETLFWSWFYLT